MQSGCYQAKSAAAASNFSYAHFEASPFYIANVDTLAPRWKEDMPMAKMMVVIREPISRAISSVRFFQQQVGMFRQGLLSVISRCISCHSERKRVNAPLGHRLSAVS